MDVDQYLERISYQGPIEPTEETLRRLQLAHLHTVPFENLDIHLGRPISLELEEIFDKVVKRRRGGYCYELNGLFSWLLHKLGFAVSLLSARVFRPDGSYGPEFDHLVLLVHPNGRAADPADFGHGWLADVGFGDTFVEPLPYSLDRNTEQGSRSYRLTREEPYIRLLQAEEGEATKPEHEFLPEGRTLLDFEGMNEFHQHSTESGFTRHIIVTIARRFGRLTLADDRLITTRGGAKEQRRVGGVDEYRGVLLEHFGIDLSKEDVDRLTGHKHNTVQPEKGDETGIT